MSTDKKPIPLIPRPTYKVKADVVYEGIREAIISGVLKPGHKLVTPDLASTLDVSRMPIREAIARLQAEGLVDVIPYKGATVATTSAEHLKEVFAVRAVLEGLAAREAAKSITAEEGAELWRILAETERLVREGKTRDELAKTREIHEAIYRLSRNNLLKTTATNLADSIDRYRFRFHRLPRRPEEVLEQHRELIDAIVSHDPERAERVARHHIECTGRVMVAHIDDPNETAETSTTPAAAS